MQLSFRHVGEVVSYLQFQSSENRRQNFFLLRYSTLEYSVYAPSCKNVLYVPLRLRIFILGLADLLVQIILFSHRLRADSVMRRPGTVIGSRDRNKIGLTSIRSKEIAPTDQSALATAHLIRVPEAARLTGLPISILRKSFMRDEKRPRNIPKPPPHKRIGRAVYILARELPAWVEALGKAPVRLATEDKKRRGRPSVAERMKRRSD